MIIPITAHHAQLNSIKFGSSASKLSWWQVKKLAHWLKVHFSLQNLLITDYHAKFGHYN